MKVSKDFSLREIAGEYIVVPTGEAARQIRGLMSLNGSGLLLWHLLEQERQEAELTAAILAEYEVDEKTAARDVAAFLDQLRRVHILVE